jgi:hypothetical protein
MKNKAIFIAHVGVGDQYDTIHHTVIAAALTRMQPIIVTGQQDEQIGIARLFPTMHGDNMIEASITLNSGIDLSKLKTGDRFNHSIGISVDFDLLKSNDHERK